MSSKLSADLLEKARRELNEDQSKVPDQVQSLREKILEDSNLNFRTDDAFLLKFLRARKFDQDRALELMTNYYKHNVNYPHLYNLTTADLERSMNSHCICALQDHDDEGRTVALFSFSRWNPKEIGMDEMIHGLLTLFEYLSEDESVQINGCELVVDLAGLSLGHISYMTPWKIKEAVSVLLNGFPMRHKAVHFVNETSLFDGVFVILKPLLSKKLQERILFHGNCYASLHEYINPEILPEELGGDVDPFDYEVWTDRVLKHFQIVSEKFSQYGLVNEERLENES